MRGIAKTRLALVTSHHQQQQEGTIEERQDFQAENSTSSRMVAELVADQVKLEARSGY